MNLARVNQLRWWATPAHDKKLDFCNSHPTSFNEIIHEHHISLNPTMPTTAPIPLSTHLENLSSSLTSAFTSLPDKSSLAPPADGISLLDVKNELFLSYLRNLLFLILLKVRGGKSREAIAINADGRGEGGEALDRNVQLDDGSADQDAVVHKLVELRVFLEKGVRPLEGKLKYQLDKVLRAADEEARKIKETQGAGPTMEDKNRVDGSTDDEHDDGNDDAESIHEGDFTNGQRLTITIDDLAYRPNPSYLLRPSQSTSDTTPSQLTHTNNPATQPYRPPRINPTAPPQSTIASSASSALRTRSKPLRSATLDEYISTELSTAPLAEPSIGSTIARGGRANKTTHERAAEAERREYEETNFVRLPVAETRKGKKGGRISGVGAGAEGGYGGEEWSGIGDGVRRIERLTARKRGGDVGEGGWSGRDAEMLMRSRKRGGEAEGEVMAGARPGQAFERKRRKLESREMKKVKRRAGRG